MSAARFADRALTLACGAAAALALAILLGLLALIVARALPALDLAFLLTPTAEAGAAGGVRDQLLGTLLLGATALALCLPLALAVGLVAGYYAGPAAAHRLRLALLTANGLPSILFGLFGFLAFGRALGWGKSWLAGGLVLGMMMLPTAALAFAERVRALPANYLEAAASLGLSRQRTAWAVVVRQCRSGLVSGLLLGLARALGETAPILFTAAVFSGAGWPRGVVESPVLALPYHIFTLAQDSLSPATQPRLWGAAALLLLLAVGTSLAALPARLRLAREARDA